MENLAQLIRSGMTLKEAHEYLYQTVKDDACSVEENDVEFTPDMDEVADVEAFLDANFEDIDDAAD